jgi:SagB-type dehydrogenase family enzyme
MDFVDLPPPRATGDLSLEEVLGRRRSRREFTGAPLSTAELGQVLWATHGITGPEGRRTAPSAGNTDPLEIYALTPEGLGRYDAAAHRLEVIDPSDLRGALAAVAGDDERVLRAGLVVALAAVMERTAVRYADRAERYVVLGVGHAAQNTLLQAEALGLGAYPMGAFDDEGVRRVLHLAADCVPLYLVPVGHPADA